MREASTSAEADYIEITKSLYRSVTTAFRLIDNIEKEGNPKFIRKLPSCHFYIFKRSAVWIAVPTPSNSFVVVTDLHAALISSGALPIATE